MVCMQAASFHPATLIFVSILCTPAGMDAGGPLFTLPFVLPYGLITNANDAEYVQLIITGAYGFGTQVPLGTSNFIANGGINQPGCTLGFLVPVENATPGIIMLYIEVCSLIPFFFFVAHAVPLVCNHFRAVQFFYYSLNPDRAFVGTHCSYHGIAGALNNLTDSCHSPVSDRMGVWAKGVPGEFQLVTTASAPFCVGCF